METNESKTGKTYMQQNAEYLAEAVAKINKVAKTMDLREPDYFILRQAVITIQGIQKSFEQMKFID
jgi:hypothetical protein